MSPLNPKSRLLLGGIAVEALHSAALVAQEAVPVVAPPAVTAAPIAQRPDDQQDAESDLAPTLSYVVSLATGTATVRMPLGGRFRITAAPGRSSATS